MKKNIKKNSFIPVDIYCDSTGLFSEYECDRDNVCTMMFPETIVRKWHRLYVGDYSFGQWLREMYTCDDTDGLYDYCIKQGIEPYFENDICCALGYYKDDGKFKTISLDHVNTLRKQAKSYDWKTYLVSTDIENYGEIEEKELIIVDIF